MALSATEWLRHGFVTDGDGRQVFVGDVVSGTTDTGAAGVKMSGVYKSTPPTFTDGQRGDVQIDSRGSLRVSIWDGVTTGRTAIVNDGGDIISAGNLGLLTNAFMRGWDGANQKRVFLASATNLALLSGTGAMMTTSPGNWAIVHLPATNVVASVVKAAGAAGVRHVATAFTATIASGSTAVTVPATPVNVVIRDGASGAGTILWQSYVSVPTTAGSMATIALADMNLIGTAATAMTIEFSAAAGVGSFESVSLSGYDVS